MKFRPSKLETCKFLKEKEKKTEKSREISYRNKSRRKISVNVKFRKRSTCVTRLVCSLLFTVSEPGMGHRHAGSQESDQSDADGEPEQKDHRQRGTEAPVDLRK